MKARAPKGFDRRLADRPPSASFIKPLSPEVLRYIEANQRKDMAIAGALAVAVALVTIVLTGAVLSSANWGHDPSGNEQKAQRWERHLSRTAS